MKFTVITAALLLAFGAQAQEKKAPAKKAAAKSEMSFFITSAGKGNGADLGGLEGADAHCASLAKPPARSSPAGRPTSAPPAPAATPA